MPSLFCPVCGTENPPTRQFCRKCAADLRAPAPDPFAPAAPEAAAASTRPIVIGLGIAFVLVAIGAVGLFLLGGSPAPSGQPTPTMTVAPTTLPTAPPAATQTAAPIETSEPTQAEPTPAETATESAGPIASGTPVVDTLTGTRTASCATTNGTALIGYVKLTWTASNTPGVRISIDPPAPNKAYDYGYEDYPASGSAEVPFTCDPPNTDDRGDYHLYVATTIHDGGYFAYRYIKVYVKA
jgi:hypothetical protein